MAVYNNTFINAYESKGDSYKLIKNSATVKVGQWITDKGAGAEALSGTSDKVLGIVTAIVNKNKVNMESPSALSGVSLGSGASYTSSTKTYVAAADNMTVDMIGVEYIRVKPQEQYLATLDAAKGTTTGSNKEGYYMTINTTYPDLLAESTASTTRTTVIFRVVDPYNIGTTTQVIVEVIPENII